MTIEEQANRDQQVVDFLRLLSNELCLEVSGDETSFSLEDIFPVYLQIYEDGEYRHKYSDIFPVLLDIYPVLLENKSSNTDESESQLLTLMANIDYIQDVLIPALDGLPLIKGFNKFYDHVMLELGRLGVWKKYELSLGTLKEDLIKIKKETDPKISELKETFKDLDKLQNGVQNSKEDISKLKTDFVTILGIFAAIMAALMGGVGFTNTLLSSLDKVVIYKLVAMTLIAGFILFNTIIGLVHLVAKITERPISTSCSKNTAAIKCGDSTCEGENCSPLDKIKEKLPYVYCVNFAFLALFVLNLGAWIVDVKLFIDWAHSGIYNKIYGDW